MSADTRHTSIPNYALHDGTPYYEPMAEWLFKTLRKPLGEYAPLSFDYERAFHKFETLMSLVYVDIQKRSGEDLRKNWAPLGRFAVQHGEFPTRTSTFGQLRKEYKAQRRAWSPIANGLLYDPAPASGDTPEINTVEHDFKILQEMISKQGYD